MKIKAFPNASGSGQWRLIHPMKYLARLGHEIDIHTVKEESKIPYESLIGFDMIVPQGVIDLKALTTLLQLRNEYGTKIVMDFDDMLQVTKDNPHYKDHQIWDASAILRSFVKFVDGVTTTNDYLADHLRQYNKNVYVIPNYMDLEYWDGPQENDHDKVRICYVGSVTHLTDVKMIVPALKKVLKKYGDKVELLMVGDLRWRELFAGFGNIECFLGVPFDNYASRLHGLEMDIGLAPLKNTDFNNGKSHIKWMENSIAGGVTVASPTVYDRVIRHGENGFIASTASDWVKYLSLLIEDSTLRKNVASRARSEVLADHSLATHAQDWEKVYQLILSK